MMGLCPDSFIVNIVTLTLSLFIVMLSLNVGKGLIVLFFMDIMISMVERSYGVV